MPPAQPLDPRLRRKAKMNSIMEVGETAATVSAS